MSILVGVIACAFAPGVRAQGVEVGEIRGDFARCRAVVAPMARLACYDAMGGKLEPPRFQGSLADETPPFDVDRPTLLRYQSDGPVFVMYLKNGKGDVVQNLHIGGGGEATYRIAKPGIYSLQISGTDTWRIWVEPEPAPTGPHD